MKQLMAGGCQCGAVRYEVLGEPLRSGFCYCRDCQRATGSGHVPFMVLTRQNLQISGETNNYISENNSGGVTIRHFCSICGSRVFAEFGESQKLCSLYAGTLDDPNQFTPAIAVFTSRRADWDKTTEDLIEHDESSV